MTGTNGEQYIFELQLYNSYDYLTYDIFYDFNTISVSENQVTDVSLNPPLNLDWLILYPMLHADIYNSFTSDFLPFIDNTNTLYIEDGKLIVPPKEDDNYLYWWWNDLDKTQLGDFYASFDLSRDLTGSNKGKFGMFFGYDNNNMYQFIMIDFEQNKVLHQKYDTRNGGSFEGSWNDSYNSFSTEGVMNVDIHYDNSIIYGDNGDKYEILINGQSVTSLLGEVNHNITRIGIVKSGSHKSIIDNFMIYY